jgi:hypothetical protein
MACTLSSIRELIRRVFHGSPVNDALEGGLSYNMLANMVLHLVDIMEQTELIEDSLFAMLKDKATTISQRYVRDALAAIFDSPHLDANDPSVAKLIQEEAFDTSVEFLEESIRVDRETGYTAALLQNTNCYTKETGYTLTHDVLKIAPE